MAPRSSISPHRSATSLRSERLGLPLPVLLSVGVAPGLTNLLDAEVHAAAPDPVDLAAAVRATGRWIAPTVPGGLLRSARPHPRSRRPGADRLRPRLAAGDRVARHADLGAGRIGSADRAAHARQRPMADPGRAHDGTSRWAFGRVQSDATALIAATAVHRVRGLAAGVHHPHQVMRLGDIPAGRGIDLD